MDRREAMLALLGIAGTCCNVEAVADQSGNDVFYTLSFTGGDALWTEQEAQRIHAEWSAMWPGVNNPPKLVITPPGSRLSGPLPGRYAFHERCEEREYTVTFQTHEEMQDFFRNNGLFQ